MISADLLAERLIVGGAGHAIGPGNNRPAGRQELSSWPGLPGAQVQTHHWSAQNQDPHRRPADVGPILPNNKTTFVAGFNNGGDQRRPRRAGAGQPHAGRPDGLGRRVRRAGERELAGLTTALHTNLEVGFNLARAGSAFAAARACTGARRSPTAGFASVAAAVRDAGYEVVITGNWATN